MTTLSTTDVVVATAIKSGSVIATVRLTGMSSLSDIMSEMRRRMGAVIGMISLNLRNVTQGWSERRSLFLRPVRAGLQLTLF